MSIQNKDATDSPQRPPVQRRKNRMFASFNNIFSNLLRKENAVIVGPSKQLTGEFPELTKERLYDFYNGWPQIKRSIDTIHQKFIGAGIEVITDNEAFNLFFKKSKHKEFNNLLLLESTKQLCSRQDILRMGRPILQLMPMILVIN